MLDKKFKKAMDEIDTEIKFYLDQQNLLEDEYEVCRNQECLKSIKREIYYTKGKIDCLEFLKTRLNQI